MELYKKFIKNPDLETWEEMIDDDNSTMIWIDHREYDEDIIVYVEDVLKTGKLSVETKDKDNKQGFEIVIKFDKEDTVIPYKGEGADRDTTITTLNEVLKKQGYEIRICNHSFGSDTLAYLVGSKKQFEDLEKEFGKETVDKFLGRITLDTKMFDMSIDETFEKIKELGLE